MKKTVCAILLALILAGPALAVRYGIKKLVQTGGTSTIPSYLGYSATSDRMYSGNNGNSTVSYMSCAQDSFLGTLGGIYPAPMVYDSVNNRLYMKSSDYFYAIDCSANAMDTNFMLSNGVSGCGYNPDNNKIYVYEGMSPIIYIYDPATYTSTGSISNVWGVMHYYNPNNSLYIPGYLTDTLNVYSGSTNARTAQVPILELSTNGGSAQMTSNPAINRLYVTLPTADQVAIINTSTNTLVNTVAVGDNPNNFALCPVNNRMFAACNGSSPNSLYYIDGSDAVDSVPVGDSVSTVVYNPSDSLIYVGCWRSGYVKLVDPRLPTPAVVDSVYTVFSPHFTDMKVDQGGDVYCSMYYSDNIYVIGQIPRRIWRSIASGMWSSYISWYYSDNGGASWDFNAMMLTPDCATDSLVTIDSTHNIQISGQAEYLDQVVIKAGGGLMIQTSTSLGDTTGYDLDVNGTLMITTADFTQNGQIRFGPNSQYIHGVDGDTIPAADWDSTSSIDILGMMFNQPSGLNQNFGTVIWDGASQEVDMTLAGEAGFSCRNLNVQGTGLARMIICSPTNPTVNIPGNLTVNSSATALICTTGTNVVRVGGTFSVLNSGQFYISDSSQAAIDTLVLEGDYQHVWTSVHGGLPGTATMVFEGSRVHNYHGEIGEMYGCVDIVVRPGSTLDIEPGYTVGSGSAGSFTLMPGATLKVRDDAGFYATGTDNGAIRVNGARNYSKQANYYFCEGPGGYVYSGDGLPDTVNMLTIDNQSGTLPGWYQEYNSITVMDTFALLAGFIDANYPITINGPVAWGSGYINGSVPITVGGSGPDIVLPTASGITLPTLTVDRPGRTVELPQSVNIADTLYLNNGSISNIGWGSVLAVNNGAAVQRTNGWVKGSLSKYVDSLATTMVYELGGDSGFTPVTMNFDSIINPEYLTISSIEGTHPSVNLPSNCLQRYWQISQASQLGFGGSAVLSYLPSDFNIGLLEATDETAMVAGGYNSSFGGWELQDIGTRAVGGVSDGGTIEITGLIATPMAKKKTADLRLTSEFTLAKDLKALQPSKMWRLSGTANYWNSGFWEVSPDGGTTWNTPSFPDSFPTYLDSTIIIMPGADVTINMDLTLDEVIDSGMVYLTGGTLIINDGPGDDMIVNGMIQRQAGALTVNTGAALVFAPYGQYIHQMDGDTIPTATWDSLSNLNITGVMTTMPAGMDQAFGNITWDGTQQTIDVVLPGGPSFSAHDVNVISTGPNVLFLTSAVKPEVTINALQIANSQVVLGSGGNRNLHVKGGLVVYDPAWLYLTDTLSPGIDTLFLYGDYFHTMAGIRGGGPDSTTIVFCGSGIQSYNGNSEILSGYINYQVNPGAHLQITEWNAMGQGSLGDFNLMAGATLSYSDYQGIYPAGQDTGVIRNLGARNYSQGANYRLYGISTGPYVTGPGIPDTVNQLIVESMMDQAVLSKDLAVMDTLKLLGNVLRISGHRLSLFGEAYEAGGSLMGDSLAQLAVMGGSSIRVTLPAALNTLGLLNINRPAAISLGSNLDVINRLEMVNGALDDGGYQMGFAGGCTIYRTPSCSLITSLPPNFGLPVNLEYQGGTITAGTEMPKSSFGIGTLSLAGAPDSLIINRDSIGISNRLTLSGGLRFYGKYFSLMGAIDTVGTPGELIFTDSCAAGIYSSIDTLFLPGIIGGSLSIDAMMGSVMQRDVACSGPVTLFSGGLAVDHNTLMLGDSLTGPGLLNADSTSSLVFQGQPVSYSLPSTINHLSKLSWNRMVPVYITAPLVLHDTLMLVQGVVDNSANLTLRSGVTILRNSGTMLMPAVLEGPVDVVYGSHGGGTLNAGNELPSNATDLNDLTLSLSMMTNDTVVLIAPARVNGILSLQQGALSVGANALTLCDTISLLMGQLATDSTSVLQILNSTYQFNLPASVLELDSLGLNSPAGMALADTVHLRSGYRQASGRIISGALTYGPAATLEYSLAGSDTSSSIEYPATGGPHNLIAAAAGGLQLHASRTVPGTLTLSNILTTGANTITVDTLGSVVQAGGFVDGNLAKLIPASADTLITFELGKAGTGPSPVGIEVFNNTLPAFVAAGITGSPHPLTSDSAICLRKYWSFSGAGLAADSSRITLSYLPADFNPPNFTEAAYESTMVAIRYDNGATPGWQFPNVAARNINDTADGGSIVLSHAGNFTDNPQFTLARDSSAVADLAGPYISYVQPFDGQAGVRLDEQVMFSFSEPVDTTSLAFSCSPDPGGWVRNWDPSGQWLTLGHLPFSPGQLYVMTIDSVSDVSGNPLRTDTTTVANPWSFTVQPNETLSTAWAGGAYRLVSVPLVPADTTALGSFGDDLGAYSDSTWRMFGYKPAAGYAENPGIFNGRGYWMASAGDASLDIVGTAPEQFVTVPVDSGWNIIGMPFDTVLDLNKITVIWYDTASHYLRYDDPLVDSMFSQRLWSWNDPTNDLVNDNGQWDSLTPYNPADSLRSWNGYAGYAALPCTLQISPIGMKGGQPQKRPVYDISWQASLGVSSGKSFDSGIKIGISPQAREKYDRLDAEKPPFIASTIKAYIPHQDWNRGPCREYQHDFRPAAEYIEWPLMVEADRADQPVVLNAQITGELGSEGHLYLLDRKSGKTFDLKTQKTIGFSGSQELAVVYSSKPFDGRNLTPLTFGLGRIGPNPFRQAATIDYQLPQAGQASMAVYNITGQRVRTLVSQNLPPGYYSQIWDGRNDGGRALPAGIYIIRLSASGRSAAQKLVKLQ